jgi:VPDSG-CTERM motif
MKKLNIVIAMLVMAAATAARADSLKLDWGSPSSGVGGEFVATVYNGPAAGTFSTWCVETDVYFSPGGTYDYQLVQTDSKGRNLALGTAWLYNQFLNGGLTVSDSAHASLFQSAIWYLQGQTEGGFPFGGSGNEYYNDAYAALGSTITDASNGAYGVSIMQMYIPGSETPAQAQLARVPDGGTTVLLLGVALMAIAAFRRRLV